jgi:hypothetical protein
VRTFFSRHSSFVVDKDTCAHFSADTVPSLWAKTRADIFQQTQFLRCGQRHVRTFFSRHSSFVVDKDTCAHFSTDTVPSLWTKTRAHIFQQTTPILTLFCFTLSLHAGALVYFWTCYTTFSYFVLFVFQPLERLYTNRLFNSNF